MLPLRRQRAIRAGAEAPEGTAVDAAKVAPDAAPDSRLKRITDAAEATTAVAKALLFIGAIVIVSAVVATTLWRDRHARHVEVSIDPEAERTLRAMGSQIDLRQTFVDVLNARIRGVEQIFTLNFAQIDTRDAPDVTFKPFGLDASTGQITKIARELTGADPPTTVRVELLCPKANCDEAGAPGSTLLVTVVDRAGSERLAIPIGGVADGLPRRLREAMRRSADLLLERAEPLIAAVYYFNVGQQRPFLDDRSRDMQRAMTSALKLRDDQGQATCIANLVIGGTLFKRSNWEDGLVVEQRAGMAGDDVCKVHAATNVVMFMNEFICDPDPSTRAFAVKTAGDALAKIEHAGRRNLSDIVADRIPFAQLLLAEMRFVTGPGAEPTRLAICRNERVASGSPATTQKLVVTQLDRLMQTLPPRADQRAAQVLLEDAAMFERLTIPEGAIVARYATSLAVMRAIERYLPADPTPRRLFALRGNVATEMAATATDALSLDDGARRSILRDYGVDTTAPHFDTTLPFKTVLRDRLFEARVDYENALAASGSSVIGESAIEVDLGTRLGDAALLLNDLQGARNGYTRAIDAFLAAESPVDHLVPLADAIARLATLDRVTGLCRDEAPKTAIARSPIGRLGISLADWCSLDDAASRMKPGLVGVVAALVKPSMDACRKWLVPSDDAVPTFRWVRCLREEGPGSYRVFHSVMDARSGATLRTAIEEALKGSASGGT